MLTITTSPPDERIARGAAGLVSEIGHVIEELHLGKIASTTPPAFAGRNDSWIVRLDSGERVFVKQINLEAAGTHTVQRSVQFARFAEAYPSNAPASPRLIGHDSPRGVLVFEHCSGTSLALLLVEERVPANFSEQVGALLAALHNGPIDGLDATSHPSPPVQMLTAGVPMSRYVNFTIAETSFWAQLQADTELVYAVGSLRESEQRHQTAPIHGDLRLDQFHLHDEQARLLDWEEFGVGDPARDLGTFAGEWIYRAVLDTVTSRSGATAPPATFDEEAATQRITERIATMTPQVRSLWNSYRRAADPADPELPIRATAHLGWHLIDRTIARAAMVARLPGIERAAAGIGRKILLNPRQFATALGFTEEHP